jgi:transposase
MAMGKKKRKRQQSMWVLTSELPTSPAHPFYARLNAILEEARFDEFVESRCRRFYSDIGRPGLAPGRYFRLFLLGYFEGLDSERGMAWRVADSLGVRSFLGLDLNEQGPDHSTISRTRRLIDVETHREVFTWVLERLAESDLLSGKTLAVDGTTLEANAAMRSIVRRDTGQSYPDYLADLARASGVKTPSRAALARLDRRRKKKGSNDDWTSPADPDAKITKMKDGRTHLAHKAEHAVDLETGAVVAVTIQDADAGDTSTLKKTLAEAEARLDQLMRKPEFFDTIGGIQEAVLDRGFHSQAVLLELEEAGIRSYVSEPDRGRRRWRDDLDDLDAQMATYANRRRIRGARGKRLHRRRAELAERSFAHAYETGAMRRTHLRGHPNILKRLLVHLCAFNLGLLMRSLFRSGTPRGFQGRPGRLLALLLKLYRACRPALVAHTRSIRDSMLLRRLRHPTLHGARANVSTTGC